MVPNIDTQLKPGVRFKDEGLVSQPAEYRIHEVVKVEDETIIARHLASGNVRNFPRKPEALANLKLVNDKPMASADLDALVGSHATLNLVDGGTISGYVSAVTYLLINVNGTVFKQLNELEVDRSGSTRYKINEIKSITYRR